jgi:hypothetical protein
MSVVLSFVQAVACCRLTSLLRRPNFAKNYGTGNVSKTHQSAVERLIIIIIIIIYSILIYLRANLTAQKLITKLVLVKSKQKQSTEEGN